MTQETHQRENVEHPLVICHKHVGCAFVDVFVAFHFHFHEKQKAKNLAPQNVAMIARPCPIENAHQHREQCKKDGDDQHNWSSDKPLIYTK